MDQRHFVVGAWLVAATLAQGPPALDIVELKNGDHLEGRITQSIDGYLELQLQAGATVGISTAQIAAVRRGAGQPLATPGTPALPPRNEWFLLHDAQGTAVGWLHAVVTIGIDGGVTITEEYEFQDGVARHQFTSLCTADPDLQPRSCYFRERRSEPQFATLWLPGTAAAAGDRTVDERIVEATPIGDRLRVLHCDRKGRRETWHDVAGVVDFPLLARERLRQRRTPGGDVVLFDPAVEEFVKHHYAAPRARTLGAGESRREVVELAESTHRGANTEWLDADARVLRRELAGPGLVAVPTNADGARAMLGGRAAAAAVVAEAGGNFGLWVPNPAWRVVGELPAGQVALQEDAHGASIGLVRMEHLEASTTLDTAADAVARWLRLLHPDLVVARRETVRLRDRQVVRLHAESDGRRGAKAVVDVVPDRGGFLVLTCRAPAAAFAELAGDFAFVARCLELDPQSLQPRLQGPLGADAPRRPAMVARR